MDEQRDLSTLSEKAFGKSMNRRSLLARAVAMGLAAPAVVSLLAACGGDDDEPEATKAPETTGGGGSGSASPTTGSASGEATTGTSSGEATKGTDSGSGDEGGEPEGEIVIMQGVDANTLDPLLRNSTPEFNINLHIFDMFLNRNSETLEIEPSIVEKWESVDDETWHFTLVDGATFHDGTPVNAEAAVFSFERAAKKTIGDKNIVQSLATQIGFVSATAVDEKTVEVKTSKPAAIFPDLLTSFEICPPSAYQDDSAENLAKVAQTPMGSGPYKFVEWVRDDHIKLEANPDYWGKKPTIKTVIFRPVPELSARVVALQNEEAQIVVNIAPDVVEQIEAGDNTRISSVTGGRIIFVGIRCDKPPFDDVRVRQAINYAVDFDSIKTALLGGYGERAATIVNPPHQNPDIKPYPYDPEKAKALLAEAGFQPGTEITMDAPNGRYIKDSEMAQAIAQGLEDIGFKVNLKVLEWSVYAGELIGSGELDNLFFLGLGSPFSGEQELFYVHPDYSLNFTRWQDDDFVSTYAELSNSLDVAKRQELMNKCQEIVMDQCPWIAVWHQVDFYGASKKLAWDARADERIDATLANYTGI
jgi:peptide/nickel transport system substrate-binding protein